MALNERRSLSEIEKSCILDVLKASHSYHHIAWRSPQLKGAQALTQSQLTVFIDADHLRTHPRNTASRTSQTPHYKHPQTKQNLVETLT